MTTNTKASPQASGAGIVLVTLGTAQFLMALDSSVMNVSIATVAKDIGTTVTGVQTAITLYTLVMAMAMVTGGKVGSIIGRRRAFSIGAVIYGAGSFTTAIAPNLTVLILGWSILEGLGAALILPAVVALVAGNVPPAGRPRAYGLVMAAGAIAIAVGPLLGGFATTYYSWRWVFAAEVVLVVVILVLARKVKDSPPESRAHIDIPGVVLSAGGLGLFVLGVLKSAEWGWVQPKEGGPSWLHLSPTVWFMFAGLALLWILLDRDNRLEARGDEPLIRPSTLSNGQLQGGLIMFFFQYLIQMGLFFTIPLFLSVALGLSAIDTGIRIVPLSITLLIAAAGIPKFFPDVSPRLVVRLGIVSMFLGIVTLAVALDAEASASVVTIPLLLAGAGIGALASQLGSVAVSAVPDDRSPEVGGLQNTATNLGASLGTALAGSILIASLTSAFLTGVDNNSQIPDSVKQQANVQLSAGVPFISDADLVSALDEAGVSQTVTDEVVKINADARVQGLRTALFVLALIALLALFWTGRIPSVQPGRTPVAAGDT